MNLQTGVELKSTHLKHCLRGKEVVVDYYVVCALLFGAPNNSGQSFESERLEVDHIKEGKEGKTMDMSLTITNLQFLTGDQNKAKFYKRKREMRKDKKKLKNVCEIHEKTK